ncbi:MAG TPA: flagellar brake protein [Syntrophomonas sp.]|nr:flagellar brake protein [Syntrophomonas sp.]
MISGKVLKINSRIEIALANDDHRVYAHSLIQDIFQDSFAVMLPLYKGQPLHLEVGDEVVVSVLIDKTRYAFGTEVVRKILDTDIKLVILRLPEKVDPANRRQLVRIKTLLPVKYEVLGTTYPDKWKQIKLTREAYLRDLSGRGLSLTLDKPLPTQVIVALSMHLSTDAINTDLKLLGEVVRCEENLSHYEVGMEFVNISQKNEDMIVKYVFYCWRRAIQLNKDGIDDE